MKLRSLSLLPVLAAPALCQVSGMPVVPYTDQLSSPWPVASSNQPSLGALVTGRFTGHFAPDVIGLEAGEPVLLTAPWIHTSAGLLPSGGGPGSTNDIATLYGFGSTVTTAIDALAMVGPTGLRVWRRDETSTITVTTISTSAWNGAQRVRTHQLDQKVIYGVAANGTSLLCITYSNGVWSAPVTIAVGSPIFDITAVDRDGNGLAEVAAITTRGLRVYSRTGALVDSETYVPTAGAITTVRAAGQELVAWVTPKAAGGSELRTRSTVTHVVDLGATVYGAISAGDATYDVRDDLVLSGPAADNPLLLFNLSGGGGAPFSNAMNTGVHISITSDHVQSGLGFARVVFADLDCDGDQDLVHPACSMEGSERRVFYAQSTIVQMSYPVTASAPLGSWEVTFSFPKPAPAYTHTEITLWEVTAGTNIEVMQPVALPPIRIGAPSQPGVDTQTVTFSAEPDVFLDGGFYALMIRPVTLTGGYVTASGFIVPGSLTIPKDGTQANVQVGGVLPTPPLPPTPPPTPPQPGG